MVQRNQNNIANENIKLVGCLFSDLTKSVDKFLKEAPVPGEKENSRTSIKRKITYLRQELLNLERILDGDA